MRVFVTGSTGYVGSAVVRAFVAAGHEVGGLVRTAEKERVVRELGAIPIYGHLGDPETYQHFAAESQAVVHAAFESPESERATAETLLSALIAEGAEDDPKSLIFTSGVWVIGNTGATVADESASTDNPFPMVAWRPAVERYVLDGGNEEVATAVVRPGIVYGGKKGGLFASHFDSAIKTGMATYIGTGTNHVPFIHVDDLAQLYLKLAEKRARGLFHGVDSAPVTVAEFAEAASRAAGKGGKTQSWPIEAARRQMGLFADAFVLDQRVVSTRGASVGWLPRHKSAVASIDEAFREWNG
jgi:nucleoside-diphosphate-sugar epimerase